MIVDAGRALPAGEGVLHVNRRHLKGVRRTNQGRKAHAVRQTEWWVVVTPRTWGRELDSVGVAKDIETCSGYPGVAYYPPYHRRMNGRQDTPCMLTGRH